MSAPQRASIGFLLSLVALLAVLAVWLTASGAAPRSDLVGSPVTTIAGVDAPAVPAERAAVADAPPGGTDRTPEPEPGLPVRLAVPALGVDAPVVPVGLEDDGTMEIPEADQAGWWWPGARPGSPHGSAVIAAHVDFNDRPGVFLRLGELEVGSEVVVGDDEGGLHRWTVTERFQVGKDDLPVDELFRTTGRPVLTLITCGGAFDRGARDYADNIVVRAVPVRM